MCVLQNLNTKTSIKFGTWIKKEEECKASLIYSEPLSANVQDRHALMKNPAR